MASVLSIIADKTKGKSYKTTKYAYAGITLYLAGRKEERILQRFSTFMTEKDFVFIPYDADVEQQFDIEPDYIIHGACKADPVAYREQPVETMLSNFIGVNTLLRLALSAKSRWIISQTVAI